MTTEQKRLRMGALFIIGFGGVTWGAVVFGMTAPLGFLLDVLAFGGTGAQVMETVSGQMLAAIMAGLCVGVGVVVREMAGDHLAKMPVETRRVLQTMIWSWCIVDSSGSILVGAPLNAIGNLVFLGLVLWPIWAAKREVRAAMA